MPSASPATLPWRLLAAVYDALPVLALWMLASAIALVLHGNRPFAPWSAGQLALWTLCWLITGLYAVLSWRRGGQTLGMRPWRLRVVADEGGPASLRALWLRYAVATLSLALGGLGFLWSLFERERRTWHDLASGTRLVREARR
jgi:uncharacterized RDD family membrane protein YckC